MADTSLASQGYRNAMLATASPRSIEGAALSRAAADIKAASARIGADHPGYIAALSRNLTLWTRFAADAADSRNGLPPELRAEVIRLATFVRNQTLRLQRGEPAEIDVLLEINKNVAAGLTPLQVRAGG
ncbi:MAG: flagellar biosynthesis regulator FlaF [Parvularculaceae bacterium]|nr:flagellar biosynthesis regulator FlaF [Parvularculaceae bacterium]